MAKKVADVESGAGVFAAIVAGLVDRVNKLGGNVGADFHRLAKPEGEKILDQLATLIVQAGKPVEKLVSAVEQAKKILKFVRSVPVPAVDRFVASEAFGDDNPAGIRFDLGNNFKTNFLGKVEEGIPAGKLNIHELTKSSLDGPIRNELGTEYEETALSYFYEVLKNNTSGFFLAYIRDVNGNLWAVRAFWSAGVGWCVSADSVDHPFPWYAGDQVLARK